MEPVKFLLFRINSEICVGRRADELLERQVVRARVLRPEVVEDLADDTLASPLPCLTPHRSIQPLSRLHTDLGAAPSVVDEALGQRRCPQEDTAEKQDDILVRDQGAGGGAQKSDNRHLAELLP